MPHKRQRLPDYSWKAFPWIGRLSFILMQFEMFHSGYLLAIV